MKPIDSVGAIYAAFGRGDAAAFLDGLDEDVEWEYGAGSTDAPWLLARDGRAAVAGFFEALAGLEIHRFEVKRLLADGPVVVALVDIEATVRASGRRYGERDEAHIWVFNEAGKVIRFRRRCDTLLQHRAFHGE